MRLRTLASALASMLLFSAFSAAKAHADEPATGFRLSAGLVSGLMLNAADSGARGIVNPQQLGFQGSMGFSMPSGFYFGGSMKIFLGQKVFDSTFMTQQFTFDLGWAIGVTEEVSVRPMLELALNRYGVDIDGESDSDVGTMMNPGVDLVADVTEHLWLGGGVRFAFALMGDGDQDIRVSDGPIDVSLQLSVVSGLRF